MLRLRQPRVQKMRTRLGRNLPQLLFKAVQNKLTEAFLGTNILHFTVVAIGET